MFRQIIIAILLFSNTGLVLGSDVRRRVVAFPQSFPQCLMITGSPAVTFTRDQGATLAPSAESLSGTGYTY